MRLIRASVVVCLGVAALLIGCGGGSGGGSGENTSGGTGFSKTITDTTNNITAFGQSAVGMSFWGFGPKSATHNLAGLDPRLGLYEKINLAPDDYEEQLFTTQSGTTAAGLMKYQYSDKALAATGPITVTAGTYSGLTGNYAESEIQNSSNVIVGIVGSISYSMPNIGETDTQNSITFGASETVTGTATTSVALDNGYTQTEKLSYKADTSYSLTSKDSASLTATMAVTPTSTYSGTISGSDTGLPASFSFDATGGGTVTFSNGTVRTVSDWVVQP